MITANFSLLKFIPGWLYVFAALAALATAGAVYERHAGRSEVQQKWNTEKAAAAIAENLALLDREQENAVMALVQKSNNDAIQKEHDGQIDYVRGLLADTKRMRIGAGICAGATRTATSKSANSGNGTDTASRLVRQDIDRDFRALMAQVEGAFAAARACQSFVRANGMAPQQDQ